MVYLVRFVVGFFVYFVHVDVDVECFLSVRAKKGYLCIGCFIALYIDKIIRLHFSYGICNSKFNSQTNDNQHPVYAP